MSEPFGKRNRRTVNKPPLARSRMYKTSTKSEVGRKVYVYVAGFILFAVLAGYAFAT